MSRYTGKNCAADSWRLCYRQGRCRQTKARTWSTSSTKPTEYSRRKNKSVNIDFYHYFFSLPIVDDLLWLDISMNVDWTVMNHKRSRIRWPSSLPHRPKRQLLFPVPRLRVTNEMLLLARLPMMVRTNGLEVGLRVAKIGRKMEQLITMHPEHDWLRFVMVWMIRPGSKIMVPESTWAFFWCGGI